MGRKEKSGAGVPLTQFQKEIFVGNVSIFNHVRN